MVNGVKILGPVDRAATAVLTPDALDFLSLLHRSFDSRRRQLLHAREQRQARFDAGELPDFLRETRAIRDSDWTVAPLPHDLIDRRVEITGPVDRKMVINALSSGATHFMADFEDSTAPTWSNVIDGQVNLRDAVRRSITWTHPVTGKHYALGARPATLLVRPRGLHLEEHHVTIDGRPMSASLFDFGLYFFHNAHALLRQGSGPYFYLPKLEHHEEAALWNDVFEVAQHHVGLPRGTIKATVLVETLPAAFQLHEILDALRHHSAGLNCGRWDYIFSTIKTLRAHREFLLPDRSRVGMTAPFMKAYSTLVIQTCHRRGVHAMGGMAAQIPIKRDPDANAQALARVRADKEREVRDGHDGTWVAHPGLVGLAREVFDAGMPGPNQIERLRPDVTITRQDLLHMPEDDTRTLEGLRHSIQVGVRYLEAWLRGTGCVPLYDLMEDAATAEICRAQVWQWIALGARLSDGTPVTAEAFGRWLDEEVASIRAEVGEGGSTRRFDEAAELFRELSTSKTLVPFLTLSAYPRITTLLDAIPVEQAS
ncbi:MAG: malate synthase A [Myxococcota bacterium]